MAEGHPSSFISSFPSSLSSSLSRFSGLGTDHVRVCTSTNRVCVCPVQEYNLKYVDLIEEQLNEALTTYRKPVDGDNYVRRSNQRCVCVCVCAQVRVD